MYSACLPFSTIPHTTRLFADYLTRSGEAPGFYPRSGHLAEWAAEEAKRVPREVDRRRQVAAVLERQNRGWGASPQTLENIERLASGALAIVTGQQVGLFGGPLFSLYKALSAIKLAAEQSLRGIACVPVFWLATEDHDLAEVNHVKLPDGDALKTLVTPSAGKPNAPVSSIALGKEIEAVVESAVEILGDGEVSDILRRAYRPGETLGTAFAKLFSRMFAHSGVVVLDASDPQLHRIAAPVYRAAIENAEELDRLLLERGRRLEAAGYHVQVHVTPSSTLVFTLVDGRRTPIHRANGGFELGGERIAGADLLARIAAKPEDFSANVLLRPVVQDYLLPTLAYVGGPAEVAYFAQAAVGYEKILGRLTPVVPRFAATLLEPKIQRLLERYRVSVVDVFQNADRLGEFLASRAFPPDLSSRFETAAREVERCMGDIEGTLDQLDHTLVDAARKARAKMRYQVERLQGKAARAELRRNQEVHRHAAELLAAIYPEKDFQERQVGGIAFLARHGTQFLLQLYDAVQTSCLEHQVIPLSDAVYGV